MTLSATALTAFNIANAAASATALAGGTVEILDGSGAVLVSAGLGTPSNFGTATTTMAGFPKTVTASGNGTASTARYRTNAAADWKTGMPCGTSGTQVVLSSLSIAAGQSVTITSATLIHSAA